MIEADLGNHRAKAPEKIADAHHGNHLNHNGLYN